MMNGQEVASLFASLGLNVNTAQWALGNSMVAKMQAQTALLASGATFAGGKWKTAGGQVLTSSQLAATGLKNMGAEAGHASKQLDGVWKLAAMGAAVVGIEHAGHALIGFNQEVQDSKISLSAMIAGMTGAEWHKAEGQASALYDEFQRFSTLTPVTTQQILDFGKGIAAATFAAGGGVEELKNLTEQGVIAAKVLAGGRGHGFAELEITEMLSGVVNKRMILARQLLAMGKMTEEQFKALDGKGRIAALQKIFNSDAMNHARDAFGKSFSGVTSTLWDNLQITFGKVGKPLFEEITAKVADLNKWMQRHKRTVEEYAKAIGTRLVTVFHGLVVAFRFVTDHANLFEGVLIGLGAFITAFAVQAAIDWAIAFWPITLAVAAIAALHAAIKWLEGDADDTADAFDRWIPKIDKINSQLDQLRNGKGASIGDAVDAARGTAQLHDMNGNPIDDEWMARVRSGASEDGEPEAPAAAPRKPNVSIGTPTAQPYRPTPVRPAASMSAPAPSSTSVTVQPQVNVTVTGNMPDGWIDAKIDTKIQDHHEETMSNAAHALQADDDE